MWSGLRAATRESVCSTRRQRPQDRVDHDNDDDGPRPEDEASANPQPRGRRRLSTGGNQRCCNCSRFQTCSAAPNVRSPCECRIANRECVDCCPGESRCCNRPTPSDVSNTPGDGFTNRPSAPAPSPPAAPEPPASAAEAPTPPRTRQIGGRERPRTTCPRTTRPATAKARPAAPPKQTQPPPGDDAQPTSEAEGGAEGPPELDESDVSDDDSSVVFRLGATPDPECEPDRQAQQLHPADECLIEVYGDTVHRNGGRQLHGGIAEDDGMCMIYDKIVSYAHPLYTPPQGRVGNEFIRAQAEEFAKVRRRETNSEQALIFAPCILCKESGVTRARDIRRRIERRMELWKQGKIAELVQDTVATARHRAGGKRKDKDDDSIAQRYHSTVIQGKLRAAKGGIYSPEDIDTKPKTKRVIDVLHEKQPELMIPDLESEGWKSFEEYDECPSSVPLDCTEETVQLVTGKLGGGAGPGSVDAVQVKDWLLHHGRTSQELREELAAWVEWLGNTTPPWAAFRALMGCRMSALDKQPGVRPLSIGEIWRHAMAKCVLTVCGEDAKAACGSTQLCAGLEAGIEGAIHSVLETAAEDDCLEFGDWEVDDDIWEKEAEEGEVQDSLPARREREAMAARLLTQEDAEASGGEMEESEVADASQGHEGKVLFLVDATNGFNMLSRLGMLWTVRHRTPKLSTFAFNCYHHEVRLVCRRPGKPALILLSKEGVTQGDPFAMALYGITLCPLAEHLREGFPEVLQPWYADDAAMMAAAAEVACCMVELMRVGPMFGYHPEPDKSWVICPLGSEGAARAAFEAEGLGSVKYSRRWRYVGGFVGSKGMRDRWVEPKVEEWVKGIEALAKVAVRYPQSAYKGFTDSLQAEWQYLSRC
ncbi:hypothetical protein ACHAWF_012611, partial [Thalassiosira exigua]